MGIEVDAFQYLNVAETFVQILNYQGRSFSGCHSSIYTDLRIEFITTPEST